MQHHNEFIVVCWCRDQQVFATLLQKSIFDDSFVIEPNLTIMTRKVRLFALVAFATTISLFSACDSDDDDVDSAHPEITLTEPGNWDSFQAGDYIPMQAEIVDDMALSQFQVEIHDNFGGHTHARVAQRSTDPSLVKWSDRLVFTVPNGTTEYTVAFDQELSIPDNAMAGPYHFIVSALDQTGNATSFQDGSTKEVTILITNNSMPIVALSGPAELEIAVGVPFIVEGVIRDELPLAGDYAGLESIEVMLGEAEEDEHEHDHGRVADDDLIDFDVEEAELENYMVDGVISVKKIFESINFTLSSAQYADLASEDVHHLALTISVLDKQGNIAVHRTEVEMSDQ